MTVTEIIQHLTVVLQILLIALLIAAIAAMVMAIYALRQLKQKISTINLSVQRLLPLSLIGSPKLFSYIRDSLGGKALDQLANVVHRIRK